jgi:hypothetical protein
MTVGPDVPDYSRASVDVERRADAEWQWGVTHTVGSEMDTVESFGPFVRRAEDSALAHQALFDVPGTSATPFSISHREWYMADNLVTVELHLTP